MQGQIRDYSHSQANAETERKDGAVDCLCTVILLNSLDITLIPSGIKEIQIRLKSLLKR